MSKNLTTIYTNIKVNMILTKTLSIIIGLMMFAKPSQANNLIIPESSDESINILVKCITNIIKASFLYKPTIFINENGIENTNNERYSFYERLTIHLINDFVPRILTKHFDIANSIYTQADYILVIKYFQDCEKIVNLQSNTINEKFKYLVVISDLSKENCGIVFEKVGKNMSRYDISYIIKDQIVNDFNVITFIPQMDAIKCTIRYNLSATLLSTCKSRDNFNVFPLKKPQNLLKCPFKVGMASLFPFSKITNKTSLQTYEPLYEHNGSDFEILKIMAHYFNFTVVFYYIERKEENPYVMTNFLEFLLNGTLDACAGGLYNIYGDIVDYSGVYGRQTVIWMYPVSRNTRSWQNLITKVNGLYIFMIFYVCYSIIWYIFSRYDKRALSVTNMLLHTWGALIGTSSLQEALTLKQKIVNIVYLVLSIHLSAYISVQLYSFLTIAGPPTIYKTNTELIESGLVPYLVPQFKYFVDDKAYEAFANTSKDCKNFSNCEDLCMKHNGVTALIDSLFTSLQARTAVNDEARTLKVTENILTIYHEMLLRKDVPINHGFRKILMRLGEAGISDRLYNEAVGILSRAKADISMKNIMSYSYVCEVGCSITLSQAAGAFYLLFFGCGLSALVFGVELIWKRERTNIDIELHID